MTQSDTVETPFEPNDRHGTAPPPSWLEWTARIVSFGLVAGLFAYLVYLATRADVPVTFGLDAKFAEMEQRDGVWVLPIDITNDSHRAVTSVVFKAEQLDDQGVFIHEATLGLLGQGETASMEMRFPTRPEEGELLVRIVSYQDP